MKYKYPISKEFGMFAHFVPPIPGPGIAGWMGGLMRPPGWFWRDPEIKACRRRIPGCGGDDIEVFLAEPGVWRLTGAWCIFTGADSSSVPRGRTTLL